VDFDELGKVKIHEENLMPFFEVRSTTWWGDIVFDHAEFDKYLNVSFNLVSATSKNWNSTSYEIQNCTKEQLKGLEYLLEEKKSHYYCPSDLGMKELLMRQYNGK